MKRSLLAALFVLVSIAGFVGVRPAQAAPPKPQCVAFIPCDEPNPIEKITRICQYAYCVFP